MAELTDEIIKVRDFLLKRKIYDERYNDSIVLAIDEYLDRIIPKNGEKKYHFVAYDMTEEEFRRERFAAIKIQKVRILTMLFRVIPLLRNYEDDYLSSLGFDHNIISDFLEAIEPQLDYLLIN